MRMTSIFKKFLGNSSHSNQDRLFFHFFWHNFWDVWLSYSLFCDVKKYLHIHNMFLAHQVLFLKKVCSVIEFQYSKRDIFTQTEPRANRLSSDSGCNSIFKSKFRWNTRKTYRSNVVLTQKFHCTNSTYTLLTHHDTFTHTRIITCGQFKYFCSAWADGVKHVFGWKIITLCNNSLSNWYITNIISFNSHNFSKHLGSSRQMNWNQSLTAKHQATVDSKDDSVNLFWVF